MSKIKLPLAQAQPLAEKIRAALAPACRRVEIAGSIRRQKAEIGDIEIVCIPQYAPDLFGDPGQSLLDLLLVDLLKNERLLPGGANGDKYKNFYVPAADGLKLDLFITSPECWGVIYTIRTGSADFSHKLVTPRKHGGLLPSDLRVADGRIWRGNEALETPEEADVFKAMGMDWIEPRERVSSNGAS